MKLGCRVIYALGEVAIGGIYRSNIRIAGRMDELELG